MKFRDEICAALLLGACSLAIPPSAGAVDPSDEVARLQREALAADGALRQVTSLVTEVGPRLAGSVADAVSIAWSERALRAAGFANVRSEPVRVPHWIRGEAGAEIVAPWPQRLALVALGGSVGTPAEGLEAEVVAVADLAALESVSDAAVRGKIVFFTQRMRRSVDGSGYGETVPIRSRGPAAAGRKGAVAVVIRSVGTDSNRLGHTGGTRYEEDAPRVPAAALSAPDADLLERQLASGEPVRMRLRLGCRTEADADSANVIGEIPGTEAADEIVLLVAHRDSWDVGHGAQDNGTGVAIAIEAARLAGAASSGGPRRTLRVVLTANEEFGLSGARAYAAAHAEEMSRHVLGLEADSGSGRVLDFATRFAISDAGAVEELEARLAPLGIARVDGEAGGGADLSPVKPFGVPLVDLDQDRTLYFDIHHTENDTLDKIDPAALRQATAAYATVAEWAANRAERLRSLPIVAEEGKP